LTYKIIEICNLVIIFKTPIIETKYYLLTSKTKTMRRQFNLLGFSLILFTAFALVVSCTGADDKKPAEVSTNEVALPASTAFTPGVLDTLYIGRTAFDTIQGNRKIAYSFIFKAADKLTLAGWVFQGSKYDSLPNMELMNGNPSGQPYDYNTYFGSVIISQTDFAKIRQALTNAAMQYVLFAPRKQGNNIEYDILVSDVPSFKAEMTILVITPTGALANPSPPKES